MAPVTKLYTIGTWRVGLSAYLEQLQLLGVRRLVDVRGNPHAGRQEELKRSKQFEKALHSVGISYEYWGRELGEDAIESGAGGRLDQSCGQLLTAAGRETICLLGHLHEPQGCHRLHVCELLVKKAGHEGLSIRHLLWRDHVSVREVEHAKVAAEAAEVLRFFNESWERAEKGRVARGPPDSAPHLDSVGWRDFDPSLFQDGRARRFQLPFGTELIWYPQWLSQKSADELRDKVFERVTFMHPTYAFQNPDGGFTNTLIKRGQVRICGDDCPGAVAAEPLEPWSDALLRRVEDAAGVPFNCFVANHYAHGGVVINWHSDSGPGDDEGLGPNPHIGSVSLGATRVFSMKSKRPVDGRIAHFDVPLTHGSLLVMGKNSQTHWLHCLPADDTCQAERLNLTFRFFARQSTKHIEGMEHNHEWEAAPGSVRVLLHRGHCGRPVLVDVPSGVSAQRLPRFLSTVLPGQRGPADVSVRGADSLVRGAGGEWRTLRSDCDVAEAAQAATGTHRAEVRVSGRSAREHHGRDREAPGRGEKPPHGAGRWQRASAVGSRNGQWRAAGRGQA